MIDLTSENFDELTKDGVVLIDFWAPWCGPCRMISPIIDQIKTDYESKAKIFKVNVDITPELATKYGVRGVPTILILKNGNLIDTLVGANSKDAYTNKLDSLI